MPAKTIGKRIDARRTSCGAHNMQIPEEFIGSEVYEVHAGKVSAVSSAGPYNATGRHYGHYGHCRQCGHDWVFRKNPLAS